MKLSFIVPAHNEEAVIGPTLAALSAAAASQPWAYEIVLVCDACSDGTAAIGVAVGARVVEVSLRNIAAVRNAGARAASGDLLFFVDADTQVTADVVAGASAAIAAGAVGGGANIDYDGELPFYVRLAWPYVQRGFQRKGVLTGAFLFCTRRAFEAAGGFDEQYYAAEDFHFCKALRKQGRVVRLPHTVLTSGRKYREYPFWRTAWQLLNMLQHTSRGRAFVKDPRNLSYWYGPRRTPPSTPPPKRSP